MLQIHGHEMNLNLSSECPVLVIGFGPPIADFGSIWSDLSFFFINLAEFSINSLKMGSFLTGGFSY